MNKGQLYVVPTPIGNLKDITERALDVLGAADLILAEDTRTTGKLLRHYDIDKPIRSFHLHNEHRAVEAIVDQINSGLIYALCSDAGTPAISDPGFLLVRACVEAGINVSCLPGATAFVPALVVSGLPCDRFIFEGFLPHKKGRQKRLLSILEESSTTVLYESPHRVIKLLEEIIKYDCGERRIVLCREISKLHEEVVRGSVREVLARFVEKAPRGEFVVVLEGK
ncbi:MAG: 16S rRNA (cytidine(1402)-2'-O)-methyltransferase [Flavobacteriales bacterium]|jgi:16S rRNA (cytidine1402-2'-O)-methyltransferase|nr:16S rRNA (cytidine(1402)-2'-O)-methyltransferase [Flavobacteriales bacterium]MBT6174274.1 16S rRNA (cytidine(1402)-2'-O)-methyltransferase [Flavobacteriales bacterium]